MWKDPFFCSAENPTGICGSQDSWTSDVTPQKMVSRILAGIQTGRRKENPKRFKDYLDLTMRNAGQENTFLSVIWRKVNILERLKRMWLQQWEKWCPGNAKTRGWFWGRCKVRNDKRKTLLYPDQDGTKWRIYIYIYI